SRLDRPAASRRRLAGTQRPGRAAVDGGDYVPGGGGRRPGDAGLQPAPRIAAPQDPRPLSACGVPAGRGGVSAIVGDFDGALRQESASLEELRGQDEPYWTTVAILTLGLVETA